MTRRLEKDKSQRVADEFSATRDSVRSSKKVLDSHHPALRRITTILNEARAAWYYRTFSYQEGVRLIRLDVLPKLRDEIFKLKEALAVAVNELRDAWDSIREDAKQRLGELFDDEDYLSPPTGVSIDLSFPSVEADKRLLDILPEVYDQERERVRLQFEQAAAEAQRTLLEEFVQSIQHLKERLTDTGNEKKIIRESAVNAIHEFAHKFRTLSIVDSQEIRELTDKAMEVAESINVQTLRANYEYRDKVKEELNTMIAAVEVIAAPKRKFELE
jgi:hypothetical protein